MEPICDHGSQKRKCSHCQLGEADRKIASLQSKIGELKRKTERRSVNALVIESEHDTEIATLQSVINRAIDFIDQNEATFDRMEVAEYDTFADAVKPYRSK